MDFSGQMKYVKPLMGERSKEDGEGNIEWTISRIENDGSMWSDVCVCIWRRTYRAQKAILRTELARPWIRSRHTFSAESKAPNEAVLNTSDVHSPQRRVRPEIAYHNNNYDYYDYRYYHT